MKPSEVKALLAFLKACYPRQELGQETLDAYAVMLADLDAEFARRAVQAHAASSPFFPTIAEIRARAIGAVSTLPPAELAWAEVIDAVIHVGRSGRPHWSSPELARAVKIIGWEAVCNSQTLGVERGHFFRVYDVIAKQAKDETNLSSLLGAGAPPLLLPQRRK